MLADLCAATTVVCYSAYEALLFITAFVLGFFGAFRISEQVPCSKFGCMGICHNQVVLEQSAVHIWLQRSKTDQYGKGAWVTLQVQLDERVCPVSVVRQFLGVRLRAGEHFLIHVNLVPLSKYQFNFILRKCLELLGLRGFSFSSHSFRIGAASEGARRIPPLRRGGGLILLNCTQGLICLFNFQTGNRQCGFWDIPLFTGPVREQLSDLIL